MDNSTAHNFGIILPFLLLMGYFIPAAIAYSRKRENSGMVFLLNLLVGWTILGWFVMLVVAFTGETEQQRLARAAELAELRRIADSANRPQA